MSVEANPISTMNREQLTEALVAVVARKPMEGLPDRPAVVVGEAVEVLAEAARQLLPLLPDEDGKWDEETRQRIAQAIFHNDTRLEDVELVRWEELDPAARREFQESADAVLASLFPQPNGEGK